MFVFAERKPNFLTQKVKEYEFTYLRIEGADFVRVDFRLLLPLLWAWWSRRGFLDALESKLHTLWILSPLEVRFREWFKLYLMRPALKDLNCCRRHLVGVLSASFTNSTSLFCASSFVVDKSKHCNMFKNLGSIYRHGITQPLIANDKKPSRPSLLRRVHSLPYRMLCLPQQGGFHKN